MADTATESDSDTGVFDTAHTGSDLAKNAPLVSDGKEIVASASNGDITSLGADVGSFAMSAATDLADPLNALISAGLGFLEDWCTPVKECLEKVTGNPESLNEKKESFSQVSESLAKLSEDLDQITKTGLQNWTGEAKDAATGAIETFIKGVDGTANNATDIASLLGISATLMDAAKEIINGILAALIEWLIITWVTALATSWCTFGASDAAAAGATAVEASVEGANAADKVEETTSFIDRIVNIIKNIIEKLKSIAKDPKGFGKEILKNHSDLKAGKEVLSDAEKDGAKAAEHAGEDTTESAAAHAEGDASSDASRAAADAKDPYQQPGFFKNKYNEAKEGLNPVSKLQDNNIAARQSSNAFQYLTKKTGSGPSPLADTFLDTGIKAGAKITGSLDDNAIDQEDDGPSGWGSQSGTIDQDLQG
jgi:hypothetical protein